MDADDDYSTVTSYGYFVVDSFLAFLTLFQNTINNGDKITNEDGKKEFMINQFINQISFSL